MAKNGFEGERARIVDKEELLSLRLRNQFLSVPCQGFLELARSLCGLQAQYFNNVLYSIMIRCGPQAVKDWDTKLIKTWTIRGTLHAIPQDDLPIYTALTENSAYITKYGIDTKLLHDVAAEIMAQLAGAACGRPELKAHFRDKIADEELLDRLFSGWGGIFTLLAAQGKIVFESVKSRKFRAVSHKAPWEKPAAVKVLVKRYFQHYGPATVADAVKFLGIKKTEILAVLKGWSDLCDVSVADKTYYYLKYPGAVPGIPKITYLTGFDPLLIGYRDRGAILPEEHKRSIITATGVIKPALMIDGRICGQWSIKAGIMQITLFERQPKNVQQELIEAGEKIFGRNFSQLEILFRL